MIPANVNIVFAEDYASIRETTTRAIEKNKRFKVVAAVTNGVEALEAIEQFKPDLLLLDLKMPVMDGHEVIEELRKTKSTLPVIVYSVFDSMEMGYRLLKKAVRGLLSKDAERDEIHQAIDTVMRGQYYVPAALIDEMGGFTDLFPNAKHIPLITDEDIAIAKCSMEGLSCEQTAHKILKSKSDVEKHRSHLVKKLEAKSFDGAVARLVDKGFIFPA